MWSSGIFFKSGQEVQEVQVHLAPCYVGLRKYNKTKNDAKAQDRKFLINTLRIEVATGTSRPSCHFVP